MDERQERYTMKVTLTGPYMDGNIEQGKKEVVIGLKEMLEESRLLKLFDVHVEVEALSGEVI